jgi:stearoyl-CoA desaturase (Delta-9 desaturase)
MHPVEAQEEIAGATDRAHVWGGHMHTARRIRVKQLIHATALLLVPAAGSLIAFFDSALHGVSGYHLEVAAAMYCVTVLGISVGFHRLLTHRAFEAHPALVAALTIAGSMAAQGPPTYWVSNHRRHHRFADAPGDPHSPYCDDVVQLSGLRGFWHAHCGWTFAHPLTNTAAYSADLLRNRLVSTLNRHYYFWVAAGFLIPMLSGYVLERSLRGVLLGFLWGGCVRLMFSYHASNAINSVAHLWGSRPFAARCAGRNNLALAILAFGEGWHNNHHAEPSAALFNRHWWQVDLGGLVILALHKLGAIKNFRRAVNRNVPDRVVTSKRVVSSRRLERLQHAHALAAHIVPLSGMLTAFGMALLVQPVRPAILVMAVLMFVLVGLGSSVGFHRYFTHCSFRTGSGLRLLLAILGSMSAQGPVVFWVALHRMHHEFADEAGDPHSPNLHGTSILQRLAGGWHAWFGWTTRHPIPNASFYAKDLLKDPQIMRVNRSYYLWVVLGLAVPAICGGFLMPGPLGFLYGFLWGGLVRIFLWHQMIYCITCVAHVSGRRDFDSQDLSRNNAWLAIPTLGESWHNNHHAFPSAADLHFDTRQVDVSGAAIRLLERIGLVWDLRQPSREQLETRRMAWRL